jgi:hypothetical protein
VSGPVFHVELRQFPNVARAFNLSREELETRFAGPWRAGRPVELNDRRWDPHKARIAVYEGRPLATEEIGLGRGWANATRTGHEVTETVLEQLSAVAAFKAELPERIALPELIGRAGARYPGSRVSERLALAEQAVWELLNERRARLTRAGREVDAGEWSAVLLSWEAWTDLDLALQSGDDVGDQPFPV